MSTISNNYDWEEAYELIEKIGQGSFGEVYRALEKATGKPVAIKLIDLEDAKGDIEEFRREIRILSQLNNPYIVEYYNSFLSGSFLWMIMEYLEGGSIKELIAVTGPLSEDAAAICLREILLALSYFHREGRLHRDIKAANILLSSEGHVKLADFGVSEQVTKTMRKRNTFVGTPFWMAPEVIEASYYDQKADIWSFGITALEMVYGRPPWADTHPMKALFLITKSDPPRLSGEFSEEFKDFICQCLQKDPDKRKNAEILLKHPFITKRRDTSILKRLLDEKKKQKQLNSHKIVPKADRRRKLPTVDLDFAWDFGTVKTLKKDAGETIFVVEDHLGTVQELKVSSEKPQDITDIPDPELGTKCRLEWKGDSVRSVQLTDGTVFRVETADSFRSDSSQINGTVLDRRYDSRTSEDSSMYRRPSKDSQSAKLPHHVAMQSKTDLDSTDTVLYSSKIQRNGTSRVSGTVSTEETVRFVDAKPQQKVDTVLIPSRNTVDHTGKPLNLSATEKMEDVHYQQEFRRYRRHSQVIEDAEVPSIFREVICPVFKSFSLEAEDERVSVEWRNALSNLETAFAYAEQCRPGFSSELVEKIIVTVHDSTVEHIRNVLPERLKVSISPCTVDGRYDKVKQDSLEELSHVSKESKVYHARRKTFA
ncbi:Serine/threonine-protein kinase svkA [Galdieria sulphuraria]|uniref:non-specific serine/threonine protein kinase n=1 Tax=Galdieria sulphuraria TaxID=130081 RepID=M2XLE1_GALSU|nr:serine/threonine protein kinase [Galdieria sulphuraria]EME30987.1 serine/threonine protein kinase [Galdieria sulphuraria]GJD10942.1 Serine/threonine-protein kinase svkA [Galdieria sulphuraria]|eukprot:XP_005707507.1 serine/threonine protein kinase [Galdieria sulphuraria]